MKHTRDEVIKRASREFRQLDRLVTGLSAAEWNLPVPRPESKDPWTVKDVLAHITYWKMAVALDARGKRLPPKEEKLKPAAQNHLVYTRYRKRTAREVLAWHRRVQADLLKALQEAPEDWFRRPRRGAEWPRDLDGHSADHRVKDIRAALAKRKSRRR